MYPSSLRTDARLLIMKGNGSTPFILLLKKFRRKGMESPKSVLKTSKEKIR